MADTEQTFKIALSMVKGMNADMARGIDAAGLTPADFFSLDLHELRDALRLNGSLSGNLNREEALFKARKETDLITRHRIKAFYLLDDDYPPRLAEVPDAPVVIYRLGDADLSSRHMVSIVGTRHATPYGADFVKKLVEDTAAYFPDTAIVSGLAYGIDAAAHSASLSSGLPTVAVLAHGLDMIYPSAHRDLARAIISSGGALLSEYPFGERPFRQRFLERNRIVAGLSDVTIVAESDVKGGAMSTANTAFSYSREVMALPGRVSDQTSAGCNLLIRKEKARLIGCAADMMEAMGWKPLDLNIDVKQRNLFPELQGDTKLIYDTLRFSREPMQLDRLHQLTLISVGNLLSLLGEMEFDGIVSRHPGNRFSLS